MRAIEASDREGSAQSTISNNLATVLVVGHDNGQNK